MGERDFELAERLATKVRDAGVRRITDELNKEGTDDCIDCGDPIPEARRRAAPNADRCIDCQRFSDREDRLYA